MKIHRTTFIMVLAVVALTTTAVVAQDIAMVGKLASQLGVSEAQALGGVQAILGTAKGNLSADQFSELLGSSADLNAIASKMGGGASASMAGEASAAASATAGEAASMTESATGDASAAMSGAIAAAGDAAGGLDLSSLSKLTGLTKEFEGLGLDAGMVQKFVPALFEQLGSSSASAGLLKQGLGLL